MSVKIAFWGMEESCHITENMIVMSWLLAKIRPAHSIFVHRENGWQCIFSGGKDRILFADCGCGRDKKTQNSLKNADVIVAGIHTYPSEWQEIIHNFPVRHTKVLYLVEGYALHASRLKTDMMDRYRIAPEQIGYIPQNGELEWVSAQGKIDNFMKSWRQVMKHYGNAILAVIVLLALGAIIVAALSSDGYVAMEFKNTLTGFFDNMNALRP